MNPQEQKELKAEFNARVQNGRFGMDITKHPEQVADWWLSKLSQAIQTERESWWDAETAPKTGEHILVTNLGTKGFGYCGGKYQDFCAVVHYWDNPGEEGFYLSSGASADIDDRPINLTHWKPLSSKEDTN